MCSLTEARWKLQWELDDYELSIFFCIMISVKVFIEQNVVSPLFLFEPFCIIIPASFCYYYYYFYYLFCVCSHLILAFFSLTNLDISAGNAQV